jgi:hypothetical protein
MAKAKRERRTSIRTMPTDNVLDALEALEQAERKGQTSGPPAPDPADARPEPTPEPEAKR